MRATRVSAVVAVVAILAISLYSAYTINGVIAADTPPTIAFALGTAYRDLTYCGSQQLDLYVPSAPARPLPLAVFVHGAGFTGGDKASLPQFPIFLNALASAGYAVASVNYRLAPQYKFPAQIEDVKCAIRYLRDHAQIYNLNSSEFFAFGTSVGGELVSLAALTGGHSAFDVGAYLNESSSLTAVADMFGPANLTSCGCFTDPQSVFGDNLTNIVLASPAHYAAPDAPPILIIHGVDDACPSPNPCVPVSQSIQFYSQLSAAGDKTQLVLVQNMGHMFAQVGPSPIDPSLEQIAQDMVSFFGQYRSG